MRRKYVDEAVGFYFIFGYKADNKNLVDINDGKRDVFEGLPKDKAEAVVEAQHYVTLESALEALDHMFEHNGPGRIEQAKAMLVAHKFKTVGRAQDIQGTAGAFTQAVFLGKEVKAQDWVYVEEK
jgi:hypothetical protein